MRAPPVIRPNKRSDELGRSQMRRFAGSRCTGDQTRYRTHTSTVGSVSNVVRVVRLGSLPYRADRNPVDWMGPNPEGCKRQRHRVLQYNRTGDGGMSRGLPMVPLDVLGKEIVACV